MIVCNCNRLNERDVRDAIGAGATCPEAAFAHHGVQPCCTKCVPEIEEHLMAPEIASTDPSPQLPTLAPAELAGPSAVRGRASLR